MATEKLPTENEIEKAGQEAVLVEMAPASSLDNKVEANLGDKEKTEARILELQKELSTKESENTHNENIDIEDVEKGLNIYKAMAGLNNISDKTVIHDNGTVFSKEHRFSFSNIENITKDQDLYLGMLGSIASSLDIDLSPGLSVEDIVSLIESRIAVSEKLAA